jgi:hypothetical protein
MGTLTIVVSGGEEEMEGRLKMLWRTVGSCAAR